MSGYRASISAIMQEGFGEDDSAPFHCVQRPAMSLAPWLHAPLRLLTDGLQNTASTQSHGMSCLATSIHLKEPTGTSACFKSKRQHITQMNLLIHEIPVIFFFF